MRDGWAAMWEYTGGSMAWADGKVSNQGGGIGRRWGHCAALMHRSSADIMVNVVSGKPSGKQLVRIDVAGAGFRTGAALSDKGRFRGRDAIQP